jgi:alkaline phosphatase/streptomycin-6-phosphatase
VYKKCAGGPGSIAAQLVDHKVDVLLGGGKQRFDQIIDGGPCAGKSVLASAIAQGYSVVTNTSELEALHNPKRVLGLFNAGNMSLEWSGQLAQPYSRQRTAEVHRESATGE